MSGTFIDPVINTHHTDSKSTAGVRVKQHKASINSLLINCLLPSAAHRSKHCAFVLIIVHSMMW